MGRRRSVLLGLEFPQDYGGLPGSFEMGKAFPQIARRQLASERISLATGWVGPVTVGIATGRSPINSAVRIPASCQNLNELAREPSRTAIATADRKGRLSSTSTPAKI